MIHGSKNILPEVFEEVSHEHEEMQDNVEKPDEEALVLLGGSRRSRQSRGGSLPAGAETNTILKLHHGTLENRNEILRMVKESLV